MATIDCIPPELLTHEIFSHIGVENQYAVYRTCKLFRSLLKIKQLTTAAEVYSGCVSGDLLGVMQSQVVIDPDLGLYRACLCGHLEIVREMIARGATYWDWGLVGACRCGHLELVREMIARGATAWDSGMYGACQGGHLAMVLEMIAQGATNWNSVLYRACRGGHPEIVREMIARGATNWDRGLSGACTGGHLDQVREMIARGATYCYNCNNNSHPEL